MKETAPIRKNIDGININTDIAHCYHTVEKIMSYLGNDGKVKHDRVIQGLYQTTNGEFFLAFWNKMTWNDSSFSYDLEDGVTLISSEQSEQWMMNYCPNNLADFKASIKQMKKSPSTVSVTIRMPTVLRDHLTFVEKFGKQPINKTCVKLIMDGISMHNTKSNVSPPQPYKITLPDGRFVIDEYEHALRFDDPDEQAFAECAETLFKLHNSDYPAMFPFILKTLYRLIHINKNEQQAWCFVSWLCEFYRVTYGDSLEFQKRNSTDWH